MAAKDDRIHKALRILGKSMVQQGQALALLAEGLAAAEAEAPPEERPAVKPDDITRAGAARDLRVAGLIGRPRPRKAP